jgi:carbamoylphosphate synthase large subunit
LKILFLLTNCNNLIILDNLLQHNIDVDILIPKKNYQVNILTEYTNQYKNCYITDNILETVEQLSKIYTYDYIFPSFNDRSILSIADINKKYNLKGITPDTAKLISNKLSYYQVWDDLDIPFPKLYDIVEPYNPLSTIPKTIMFPCIVKPSVGTSSVGIQIIENLDSLIDFFSDTDEQTQGYQEQNGNSYKKLQYCSGTNEYIIQTYIEGDVVSFIGHSYNGQISFDFIFDIESTSYPYAAETGLVYPSKYSTNTLTSNVIAYLKKFFKKIKFDNSAFMLDIIIDKNGSLHFIDFSPRLSVSHILLWHAGEKNYGYKLIKKLLYGEDYNLSINKSVLFRQLPFEKREIQCIEVKEKHLADVISLPKGKIQLVRNDLSVFNNGWAIFTGKDLEEIEEKYQNFISAMTVTYTN